MELCLIIRQLGKLALRGSAVPEYRFYTIKRDGHIAAPPAEFDLPNDDAALKEAKQLLNGHDIEIWQGGRVVAYLTPN
jgi:hypothetical protein